MCVLECMVNYLCINHRAITYCIMGIYFAQIKNCTIRGHCRSLKFDKMCNFYLVTENSALYKNCCDIFEFLAHCNTIRAGSCVRQLEA